MPAAPTTAPRLPRGLYVITDADLLPDAALEAAVAAAIAGGARVVQYRDKSDDAARRHAQAAALVALCHARGVPLIVNDDVALAAAVGAAGVHVGKDDAALAAARAALGPQALIGVSCYADLALARAAVAGGADYVAFGAFFPSRIKPGAVRADPALLRAARAELPCPIVAIGGITAGNGAGLVAAGADSLAVISDVFGATDMRAAAAALAALFGPEAPA